MKTKILLSILLLLSINIFAQLRVDPSGRIGMGTDYPNPEFKLHIKGNLLLTTYPEIAPPNPSFVELRFKVGNGWPGAEIGTGCDAIAFWTSGTAYNKLYAEAFYTQSDSTSKANIVRIQNSLDKLKRLNSYSYYMKDDNLKKLKYGFLAQEVKNVFPEITDTAKGLMLIDYNQIIPLIVMATNEQNKLIEDLQNELNGIKSDILNCCSQKNSAKNLQEGAANSSSSLPISNSTLFQNQPNPFTQNTKIEFEIIEKYSTASILIFDMQGTLKKSIPISGNGKGQIMVNGNELVAGMYLYSLIVDGKEIDTKRMILMN